MMRFLLGILCFFLVSSSFSQENRTITGIGNNPDVSHIGSEGAPLIRYTKANYADGFQAINDQNLPGPREVSNSLFEQLDDIFEPSDLSDYVWLFGQFLDHDISLVENDEEQTPLLLDIPADDAYFNSNTPIFLSRNKFIQGTGVEPGNPREYANEVTSFIDASMVYGSTEERADWLRTFEDGKMKMAKKTGSTENLLPWNTLSGEFNDAIDFSPAARMADDTRTLTKYFVAGDVRANENPLLIAIHTLFVREHNRLCDELIELYPNWNDEQLYQRARKYVGAYIQAITYYEWLPAMGVYLTDYQGYDSKVDPSIMNVFSAAAFRIGHTMIDDDIIRMNNEGEIITAGNLKLKDAFFKPYTIVNADGLDPYFKGMGTQIMQEMDCKVIGDLRNFLFEDSGVALDLASINIFRGRERGLLDYNSLRSEFGLTQLRSFSDFSDNEEDVRIMTELYGDVNNIDAWVGMLAEPHIDDEAVFGELVMEIVEKQFRHLRDGDRFYFENDNAFTQSEKDAIKRTSLHDIIMRNTNITLMQPNVFEAMPHMDIPNLVINEIPLEALAFPNPVETKTTIKVYSDIQREMTYKLFSPLGKLIQSGTMKLYEGQDNYLELELDGSAVKGYYPFLLESDELHTVLKLVKQ